MSGFAIPRLRVRRRRRPPRPPWHGRCVFLVCLSIAITVYGVLTLAPFGVAGGLVTLVSNWGAMFDTLDDLPTQRTAFLRTMGGLAGAALLLTQALAGQTL